MKAKDFIVVGRPQLAKLTNHPSIEFADYERRLESMQSVMRSIQQAYLGSQERAAILLEGWDTAGKGGIEGGHAVIVFLELDLGKSKAPGTIEHSLRVLDDHHEPHDIAIAPLPVSAEASIVVAPPLRGEWIAGDSASNRPDAAHRRAVLIDGGHAWLAQRFAIDWVQYQSVDGERTTWKGPEDRNESYFCYDQPIYSVAAGKVVDMSDGMAENVPHSGKYVVAIDFNNAAGNHIVVEIAQHRYVLYAHMRPGTVQVKVGDQIGVGQIVGRVGNTGSSAEPHLHMHIDDQPSFLVAMVCRTPSPAATRAGR